MYNLKQSIILQEGISETKAEQRIREAQEEALEYLSMGDLDSANQVGLEYFGAEIPARELF